MNTQSKAMPESLEGQTVVAAALPETRPFLWSMRRELWENRYIYLAPLGVAAVFLLGFLISTIHLPAKIRGLSLADPMHYRAEVVMPYDIIAGVLMITTIFVNVFYCVEALQSERRDRSILFWKSLPVSDWTTVLAKASMPLVVVPLVAWAVTAATQWIMLLVSSAVLLGSGLSVVTLWRELAFFRMAMLLLYHFLTAHAIWPFPVYCWLLLVSAWARRASWLWAVLPLVAISGLEMIVFHTSHFGALVGSHLVGAAPTDFTPKDYFPTGPMTHVTPERFLASLSVWIGFALAAAFLAGAVRMRRVRGPM